MPGQVSGRDQNGIEPDFAFAKACVPGKPMLRSPADALGLSRRQRGFAFGHRGPAFHLDESDAPPTRGNQVDLAVRCAVDRKSVV